MTTCAVCDRSIAGLEQYGPVGSPVCQRCWYRWAWCEDLETWLPRDNHDVEAWRQYAEWVPEMWDQIAWHERQSPPGPLVDGW
jgi:hypothetical protein